MRIAQIKAKIISNKRLKNHYWHLEFESGIIAKNSGPGQFVEIKVNDGMYPLLRRPFSIHKLNGSTIEILYGVLGPGTEILSQKERDEYLDIIGPLGKGFDCQSPAVSHQSPVLVAGGMGVAPLLFLAEKAVTRSPGHQATRNPLVLLGAKTKSQILCEKEFKKLGCDVKIATDDGSRGFKGTVTLLLSNILSTQHSALSTIYACGPRPMLKEVCLLSKKYNLKAQVSLEEHMSCGIGACFGCVVKTKEGFKRVCKEGPVFGADEIVWGDTR